MFLNGSLPGFAEEIVPIEKGKSRDLRSVITNPKLFVFIDGYMGFNEIRAINNLEADDERIICGSHLTVTPRDYLEEILEINHI